MGFLDHSTNNIIIDAVLTDTGRRLLADNQGKFRIAFFSLADDEVDYQVIEKYGRAVGTEKILKNTPVFEAQTAGQIALKNRLLTLPDPTIVKLPKLELTSPTGAIELTKTGTTQKKITLSQTITGAAKVPDGLSDVSYTVMVPDRFLRVNTQAPQAIQPITRTAVYTVPQNSIDSNTNGSVVEFNLQLKTGNLDTTTFNTFGDVNAKTQITTVISVIGDQSGLRREFTVLIKESGL